MGEPSLRVGLGVESEGGELRSVFRRSSLSHSCCDLLFLLGISWSGPLVESDQIKNQKRTQNTEMSLSNKNNLLANVTEQSKGRLVSDMAGIRGLKVINFQIHLFASHFSWVRMASGCLRPPAYQLHNLNKKRASFTKSERWGGQGRMEDGPAQISCPSFNPMEETYILHYMSIPKLGSRAPQE